MRRLLALPVIAAAIATATPASATVTCTPTVIGACVDDGCVDLCGPEYSAYLYCNMDSHPRVLACDLINRYGRPLG